MEPDDGADETFALALELRTESSASVADEPVVAMVLMEISFRRNGGRIIPHGSQRGNLQKYEVSERNSRQNSKAPSCSRPMSTTSVASLRRSARP